MSVLQTQLNARSADFQANAAVLREQVQDLAVQLAKVAAGGGEAARAKHVARGKLPPRERVQMLLDPGTPFLELAPLAALAMYPDRDGSDSAPCAGLIAGVGRVSGIDCLIICKRGKPTWTATMSIFFCKRQSCTRSLNFCTRLKMAMGALVAF